MSDSSTLFTLIIYFPPSPFTPYTDSFRTEISPQPVS